MNLETSNTNVNATRDIYTQSESMLKFKLNQIRRKINKYEVALNTFTENNPKFRAARDRLNEARAEYFTMLNKLNRLRSKNKKDLLKENSKGLNKVDFKEYRDITEYQKEISQNDKNKKFTYTDDVGSHSLNSPYLNYRHNVLDTVIF